jgi:hypothetical protein
MSRALACAQKMKEGVLPMRATGAKIPKFHSEQKVRFVGGEGIVRNYRAELGGPTYFIEMALGKEPDFGRIGAETTILLSEADLRAA